MHLFPRAPSSSPPRRMGAVRGPPPGRPQPRRQTALICTCYPEVSKQHRKSYRQWLPLKRSSFFLTFVMGCLWRAWCCCDAPRRVRVCEILRSKTYTRQYLRHYYPSRRARSPSSTAGTSSTAWKKGTVNYSATHPGGASRTPNVKRQTTIIC